MKLGRLFSCAALTVVLLLTTASAGWSFSYEFGPWTSKPDPAGADDFPVYEWDWDTMSGTGDSCSPTHVADGSSKPLRDSQGRVQIVTQGDQNRRLMGTSFGDLEPEQKKVGTFADARPCATNATHPQEGSQPPDKYHSADWITTPYRTADGTIHVLTHHEYWGAQNPFLAGGTPGDACDSEVGQNGSQTCWHGSTTYSRSRYDVPEEKDGARYTHATPPQHYEVSLPYQYTRDWGRHGLVSTANLILNPFDDYFYTVLNAENQGFGLTLRNKAKGRNLLQKEGGCIVRSPSLPDDDGWRGWQGYTGFSATFPNPYPTEPADKAPHVCESVTDHFVRNASDAFRAGGFVARGLSYNNYLGRFMMVGNVPGIRAGLYSLSSDMINWSDLQLLLKPSAEPPPGGSANCGTGGMSYPTVADPSDGSTNFERPGRTPNLFYTCGGPSTFAHDVDVMRVPFKLGYRSATFEDGALVHSTTGFDSVDGSSGLSLVSSDRYEGTRSVKADYQGASLPRGTVDGLGWKNGSDVWYSAAFKLPAGFATDNAGTALLRWENNAGDRSGGVVMQNDDSAAVQRGSSPIGSDRFYLPEKKWFWLEVHQRLDQSRPLSEVFIDGRLVWTSNAANNYPDGDGHPTKIRFGFADGSPATGSFLHMDRATISESQRGAYGVPPAPTEWSAKGQYGSNVLQWQAVPGATGYRIYRREPTASGEGLPGPNVTWQLLSDTTALSLTDNGRTNGQPSQYRITAYNSVGDSMTSAPKQATPGGRVRIVVNVVGASNNDYTTVGSSDGTEITDPQDFQFLASTSAGFDSSLFTLDDDPTSAPPTFPANTKTGTLVAPGSGHWAGMIVPPGWQQVSNGCDNGSTTVNITVYAGETVNCWFVLKRSP